jgi:hypothetical protein
MFGIPMFDFSYNYLFDSMKHAYLVFAFALFILSCKSTPDAPTTDGSYIIADADTVTLQKSDSSKTLGMRLSCGCGFTLQVTSASGDTKDISYLPGENFDSTISRHSIVLSYSPAQTSSPQSLTLNFLAHKHSYSYTHSIMVKVSN